MSNVMTPERIKALTRLRAAQGELYTGSDSDAYEMFLVVDECFRNSETEDVATWLPYTPDVKLRSGEHIFAIRNKLTSENRPKHIYRVWDAKGLAGNCLAGSVDWYMPLSPNKLPNMQIQEETR